MKRILMALAVLAGVFAAAIGATFERDGFAYTVTGDEEKTVELTKWLNSGAEVPDGEGWIVTVPASVEYEGAEYAVTTIAKGVFSNEDYLLEVTLPNSISPDGLGGSNFGYCPILRKVALPDGLEAITDNSFVFLPELRSIELPDGLETISMSMNWCGFESLSLPKSLETVSMSLWSCRSLKHLEVNTTMTLTKNSLTGTMAYIEELVFTDDAVVVEGTFNSLPNLKRIVFSKGCWAVGSNFEKSVNLREVVCEDDMMLFADCPLAWACSALGKELVVWVPEGLVDRYAAHADWGCFTIKGGRPAEDMAGVDAAAVDMGGRVEVYTFDGICRGTFASEGAAREALGSGIYVVRGANGARLTRF